MQDLAEASGVGDTTRLRSRYLEELDELGIVELPEKGTRGDKAVVRLTREWRRRLDERREMGGELSASRRQAAKHRGGIGRASALPRGRPGAASYGPREVG